MRIGRISLLLLCPFSIAQAQHAASWQGEWGAFANGETNQGQRLSIHDCHDAVCKFSIESRSSLGHAETASDQTLTILSPAEATATLPGETNQSVCALHFERKMSPRPSIAVRAVGESCTSDYSTNPAVTMSGAYPFRSATNYPPSHADECFVDNSPARIATCTRSDVAALEQKWQDLAEEYPVEPPVSRNQTPYEHLEQMEAAILHSCDADASPATCLTARYTHEIAAMQARKEAYLQGTVERGDPVEGGRLAAKIAGRYRHRFRNADVDGHTFSSTDTLTIRRVGASSIHFDMELNFYNGHTCSLSGGALYRKDGSFVFDGSEENIFSSNPHACRLAIIPTATGVEFRDIYGTCKYFYCGERGSFDGEGFTFQQRIANSGGAAVAGKTTP